MISIKLRPILLKDLEDYYIWNLPHRLHHDFDGPYFVRQTEMDLKASIEKLRADLEAGQEKRNRQMIVNANTDELIGQVSWYWKSEETAWMEIGITIFNEGYWSKGIGLQAMILWVNFIFKEFPELVRLGLTTWSGNYGMMRLAEKMGFKKEAVYRDARIVKGEYFDSVSYGILKKEWEICPLYEDATSTDKSLDFL